MTDRVFDRLRDSGPEQGSTGEMGPKKVWHYSWDGGHLGCGCGRGRL